MATPLDPTAALLGVVERLSRSALPARMAEEFIALGVPHSPRRLVVDRCDCPRCPASCRQPCRRSRWEAALPHKERWVAFVTHCAPRLVADLSDADIVRGWARAWRTHAELVLRGLRGRPGLKGAVALALPAGQRAEFRRRADEWDW